MNSGSQLIESMASVTVSRDMLEKVDINNLVNEFKHDYDKLDDLKKFRQRHEDRNAISRWWNNDELEDAQLNAAELQASFSKKLGQLMVISIAQSQQLNKQQTELAEQQQTIKAQTAQLARNDTQLEGQHQRLEKQNLELEQLVREYFALKGLTEKGAKKLIEIAQEVQQTRDDLLEQFDKRMALLNETYKLIDAAMERLKKEQAQSLADFRAEAEHRHETLQQQTQETLTSLKQQLNEATARYAENAQAQQQQWQQYRAEMHADVKAHAQEVRQWISEADARTQETFASEGERWQQTLTQLSTQLEAVQREHARSQRNWRLWGFICTPLLVVSLVGVAWLGFHLFHPLS